jgi:hypothetical protein
MNDKIPEKCLKCPIHNKFDRKEALSADICRICHDNERFCKEREIYRKKQEESFKDA